MQDLPQATALGLVPLAQPARNILLSYRHSDQLDDAVGAWHGDCKRLLMATIMAEGWNGCSISEAALGVLLLLPPSSQLLMDEVTIAPPSGDIEGLRDESLQASS